MANNTRNQQNSQQPPPQQPPPQPPEDDVNHPTTHYFFIHKIIQTYNAAIEVYNHKLKGLWDEYDSLEAPYMCVCICECENRRVNGERDQRKRLIRFLMGLDECYANIRGQILLMNPMPTVAKAYSMIRQEEKQREGFASKILVAAALSAHFNNYRNSYNNGGRNGRNYSGNYSQVKRDTQKKNVISWLDIQTVNITMGQNVNLEATNVSSQQMGQSEVAMCARIDQLNQLNQMMLMMQNNKDSLPGMSSESIPKLIATFTTRTYRLIASHITDKKYKIIASALINQMYLWVVDSGATDHDHHKRIAHGNLYNGLYIIKQEQKKPSPANLSITNNNMSLWHSRLGHPSFSVLQQIKSISILDNLPKSYSQTAKDLRWIDAMNEELKALEENKTWTLTLLPPNKKAIGYKWVYKIKFHSDGTVERYKARLVAQGFTQQERIDYTETFAPVAKMVTVRTLLVKGSDFLALLIYVDDILLTGNNITLIHHFKNQLDLTFSIKDLGNLNYYPGIEFLRNPNGLTMS
ncbi:cysteine-rich receptor-like protein kinase 8 [Tanacetum coccineum]